MSKPKRRSNRFQLVMIGLVSVVAGIAISPIVFSVSVGVGYVLLVGVSLIIIALLEGSLLWNRSKKERTKPRQDKHSGGHSKKTETQTTHPADEVEVAGYLHNW